MRKFLILAAVFFVWVLVFSPIALSYQDYIWVYKDPNYTQEATAFDDGDTVYIKVTNYITQSTSATVTVTNGEIGNSINVSVTYLETPSISDDPTIHFGSFVIHSSYENLTTELRIFDGQTATITADLDGDGKAATAKITAMYTPPAPTNLQAVPIVPERIKLTWNPSNPEDTVVQYNVYRGTSPGGEDYTAPVATIAADGSSSYTLTDSGLTAGQTYYYTVRAQDGGGSESESSNEASAKVKQELLLYRTESKVARSNSPVKIVFSVSKEANITFTIYNLLGEVVKKETTSASAGTEIEWMWDGRNMHGEFVNNGTYILVIEAVATDGEREIKRRIVGVLY